MEEINPKPPDPKSFREAVSPKRAEIIDVSFPSSCKNRLSSFKGEPALLLNEEEEESLAQPFQLTLIGKFSKGRPSMVALRKEILAASFSGECHLGLLDYKHVLFKFEVESDFHRMWMLQIWTFNGFPARLFKWSTNFNPSFESSIAPVWIKLPQLPLHLFARETLFSIASAVGNPLKLDRATTAATKIVRPSEARICVELDVTKERPNRVWVGSKERGR